MKGAAARTLQVIPGAPTPDLRREAAEGLSGTPKTLPCKFLYDSAGTRLFERICSLEAYYPTRTELGILEAHVQEMADRLGPHCRLVELGSGSAVKTRLLLDALQAPAEYVPVDIAGEQLESTARELRLRYPEIRVTPVWGDYTAGIAIPPAHGAARSTGVFFPGSTIGNFEPAQAVGFLESIARLAGRGGRLLIGVDLRKDRATLERAYDDPEGVTAAFNLNLLDRLNRECGTDFDRGEFRHRAVWNEEKARVEMHLVSRRDQEVRLPGAEGAPALRIRFAPGEPIVTEHAYKYTVEGFGTLAGRAGFQVERVWSDPERRFTVQLLRAGQRAPAG
jgi:dimethylhistidine N-methyltransferase